MNGPTVEYPLKRPLVPELRRVSPGVIIALAFFVFSWARADEAARAYSEFQGVVPPELPPVYWWGSWFLLVVFVVVPVGVLIRRVTRKDPMLSIDADRVESSYSTSSVRSATTERVTEVHLTGRRAELRFVVPDGLAPHVPSTLFDDGTGMEVAVAVGRLLKVPVFRVIGPPWKRRKVLLESPPTIEGRG